MEKFTHNNPTLKERRRELRNNQTQAEKYMWYIVNKSQINGLRFLRQYSIGPYILDFYCPKIRLAIEVDGDSHTKEENKIYDNERSRYLETFNIKIIRFWNDEVMRNMEEVKEKIIKIVSVITPQPPLS